MMKHELSEPKRMRWFQTILLALLMLALVAAVVWRIFGADAVMVSLAAVGVTCMLAGSTSFTPAIRDARPLSYDEAPDLYETVKILSRRSGLQQMPRLSLLPADVPFAASVGTRHRSFIYLSPSLLSTLTPRELAAVMAHEISHIAAGDLALLRFAELLRRITSFTSSIGWFLVLFSLPMLLFTGAVLPPGLLLFLTASPIVSLLLYLGLTRTREYRADLGAAELTGDPLALASALVKIERTTRLLTGFLMPTREYAGSLLLRTHPPTEKRIRRLEKIAAR